jgi:L-methionine (R)-S-oxide reductase
METITITTDGKKEKYEELLPQIASLVEDESDLTANLANVSAALKSTFSSYSWVGFYRLVDGELVLGPFQGKVACVRIKVGRGVCGTAVKEKKTIVVPDVDKFPGHIACDPDSKSEIVVPLLAGSRAFGVLDVDSDKLNSFDGTDKAQLERVAEIVTKKFIQSLRSNN